MSPLEGVPRACTGDPRKVAMVAAMHKLLFVLNAVLRDQSHGHRDLPPRPTKLDLQQKLLDINALSRIFSERLPAALSTQSAQAKREGHVPAGSGLGRVATATPDFCGHGRMKPHCKQVPDAVDRPTVSACAVRHMRGSQIQSFPTTGQAAPLALPQACTLEEPLLIWQSAYGSQRPFPCV